MACVCVCAIRTGATAIRHRQYKPAAENVPHVSRRRCDGPTQCEKLEYSHALTQNANTHIEFLVAAPWMVYLCMLYLCAYVTYTRAQPNHMAPTEKATAAAVADDDAQRLHIIARKTRSTHFTYMEIPFRKTTNYYNPFSGVRCLLEPISLCRTAVCLCVRAFICTIHLCVAVCMA